MTVALLSGTVNTCSVGLFGSVSSGGASGFWGEPIDCSREILGGPGVFSLYSVSAGALWHVDNLSATIPTLVRITRTYTAAMSCRALFYPGRVASTTIGDSVKVTRVQTTQESTASSYIPTTSTSVARAADVIQVLA